MNMSRNSLGGTPRNAREAQMPLSLGSGPLRQPGGPGARLVPQAEIRQSSSSCAARAGQPPPQTPTTRLDRMHSKASLAESTPKQSQQGPRTANTARTPTAQGGFTPKFDPAPLPKYITEAQLEARLAAHKQQIEDMMAAFCDTISSRLQKEVSSKIPEETQTAATAAASVPGAEKASEDSAALATAVLDLDARCSKTDTAINEIQELCKKLQLSQEETSRKCDNFQTKMDAVVKENLSSMEDLRSVMQNIAHIVVRKDVSTTVTTTPSKAAKTDGLSVVREEKQSSQVEWMAADEAAGSPVKHALRRSTPISSIPVVPQMRVPPQGDASPERRHPGLKYPSFDEHGANFFMEDDRQTV